MKTIQLTGRLGKEFGQEFNLDVRDPAEAVRALCLQIEGFEAELKKGQYRLQRVYEDNALDEDLDNLHLSFGKAVGYRITPVVGGNRRGLGKLVLGVLLVGAAFFTAGASLTNTAALAETAQLGGLSLGVSYGNIAFYGAIMALQGAASLLTPTPENNDSSLDSFILDYTGNIARQGAAVPVIFGRVFTGSVVVSVGITAEDIASGDSVTTPVETVPGTVVEQ